MGLTVAVEGESVVWGNRPVYAVRVNGRHYIVSDFSVWAVKTCCNDVRVVETGSWFACRCGNTFKVSAPFHSDTEAFLGMLELQLSNTHNVLDARLQAYEVQAAFQRFMVQQGLLTGA